MSPLIRVSDFLTNAPQRSAQFLSESQRREMFPAKIKHIDIAVDKTKPFETSEQERFARWVIKHTLLPTGKVKLIAYQPNGAYDKGTLGSAELGGTYDGRLTFYKDLHKVSAGDQFSVGFHEMLHFNNPFDGETNTVYGSDSKRRNTARNVMRFADNVARTGVFIDDYHEHLFHQYQYGQISKFVWLQENHAILGDAAANKRDVLARVEQEQLNDLQSLGQEHLFVPLVSKQRTDGSWDISETDRTILQLTDLHSIPEMHAYFDDVKAQLTQAKTPFHSGEMNPQDQLLVPQDRPIRRGRITQTEIENSQLELQFVLSIIAFILSQEDLFSPFLNFS